MKTKTRQRKISVTALYSSWSEGHMERRIQTVALSLTVVISASPDFGDATVASGVSMVGTQHLFPRSHSCLNRIRAYTTQSLVSPERL